MTSSRPLLLALLLPGVALSGCATLRAAVGLCHAGIEPAQLAEQQAAQGFTEDSFASALQQRGLTREYPGYSEHHASDHVDEEPDSYTMRYSELQQLSAEAEPVFARDAAGVLHPIVRAPRWIEVRSYPQCDCQPGYHGGITPGYIVRVYRTGPLGPPLQLPYDAKTVIFRRDLCPETGPPRV